MSWILQIILKNLKVGSASEGRKQGWGVGQLAGGTRPPALDALDASASCVAGLQINCSETTILNVWHKDALDYFNNSGMVRA